MSDQKLVTYLCGRIDPDGNARLQRGVIGLKSGEAELWVVPFDPGLRFVEPGKRRMVVVKGGDILAVFGKPRIRLIGMIERGVPITGEVLGCSMPMYLRREYKRC